MEYPLDQENEAAVQEVSKDQKGGFKTIPFIIANEIFEKVANIGLVVNMIIYLTKEYHMKPATGASVIFIWLAGSNFTPIFGAFLADSYLGRYRVIAFGSFICLSGMIMLWMTANIRRARPPSCGETLSKCESPNASQLAFLFSSFALMSLGSGGIRPCSLAFGADQLNKKNINNPNKERALQTFFNWYYASVGFSIVLASTVIVYIQDKKGFKVGFGVPVVLMLLSACFFLLGSGFYIKVEEKKNILLGFIKVLVLSYKNKGLNLPPNDHGVLLYHHRKGSNLKIAPSEKLRFLNKACMNREHGKEIMKEVDEMSWSACTVEQVEEVKSVLRVAPIWSTGIVMGVIINQHSFPVLQAKTMDRHLTSNFQIPAGSFGVFAVLTLILWVTIYDRIVVPQLSKITGRPRGLTFKQRMGIGLVFSCLAMMVAAIVEAKRRKISMIQEGLTSTDGNTSVLDMSAMWLLPQFCIIGLAEAFNIIGQIEFYYSEIPKSMASFAMALYPLGSGTGNLLGSLIIEMIDKFTKNKEKKDYVPTVFDNFNATVSLDGSTINLGLWDTAGQEDLSKLRPLSYRGADIFLLVFSLVSRASYENVFKKWMPELRRFAPNVPIVLVGSKLDLCNDTRYLANHPSAVAITTADGEKLRQQIGAAAYIECSSKTQKNIKAVFDTAIKVVVQPPQQQLKKKSWRRFPLIC
ncbi:hypothetical protein J5N97_019760 [Dioscorea zingiberensis]|uniref:Uncharacterized protein n=1 Tax=Dioscorea zingiberensis TaxID=325984 RepID=A0A9D5CEL3_9LILI|nr:hypothetical protein J5N97_019760 [Dioscorea zingiberensis]